MFSLNFISSEEENTGESIIVLVSDNFADGAVSHCIADKIGATIMFTPWGEYEQEIADMILSANPDEIYIIGGYSAVPNEYDEAFTDLNLTRIGGGDRSQTSMMILQHFKNMFQQENVHVVNGQDDNAIGKALQNALEKGSVFVYTNRLGDDEDVVSELDAMGMYWGDSGIEKNNGQPSDEEMMASAEAAITDLNEKISQLLAIIPDYPSNAIIVLHSNAVEKFESATAAFDEGDYGKAYTYAKTGLIHANNALSMVDKGNFYKGNLSEKSGSHLEDLLEKRAQLEVYMALAEEVPEDLSSMITDLDALITEATECYEAGDYECTMNKVALANYELREISKQLESLLGLEIEVDCNIQENALDKLNELLVDRQELDELLSVLEEVPEDINISLAELDQLISDSQACYDAEDYVCTLETVQQARSLLNEIEHSVEGILGNQGNNGDSDNGNNGKGNEDKDNNGKGNDK